MVDINRNREDFLGVLTRSVSRRGIDTLVKMLIDSDFFTAPASTRFHGDHEGGLCEHSLHVWEELMRLLSVYPEVQTTGESAAIVSLLHDVCKIGCYKQELRNVKVGNEWIKRPYYTFQEDFPYGGHGSKSVFVISQHFVLTAQEAVAINCHMGPWDRSCGDYSLGAAYETNRLAWLLHVADEAATYIRESKA